MSLLKEFKEFAIKGNVVDLAVAVVIGGAFGKIVSAFVSDLVMPLVNALTPGGDWRKLELTSLHFKVGDFLGTVVDFVIVAAVVFIVIQKLIGAMNKVMPAQEAQPVTKQCPECFESVPKAARRCRACTSVFVALVLLLVSSSAFAQAEVTPESDDTAKADTAKAEAVKAEAAKAAAAKAEAEKSDATKAEAARLDAEKAAAAAAAANAVEWKAQSKGGFLLTSGNSQTTNATFGVNASRKQGNNKLTLEGVYAYGKSSNLIAQKTAPDPANPAAPPAITGYDRQNVVSTNNWMAKGRYDRFLTENNSLYASGQGAGDKVAGKMFFGGGQAGYSRQLFKDKMHLVVAELGYDFSYLVFETSDPSVAVHSARAFVGETLTLTQQTGMTAGVEGLFNLNKETKAKNVNTGDNGVDPFKDTRVNAKIGISTNLYKSLSLGLGFTFKYTQNPAPRPLPDGLVYADNINASFKYADKVDTITEATLTYTFF
jgi:large conductance mechanosensitive channel